MGVPMDFDGGPGPKDYKGRATGGAEHIMANLLLQVTRMYLQNMDYREYLKTDWWRQVRLEVIRAAGKRCQRCSATGVTLDVHHLTYVRRGAERLEDLQALCRPCHDILQAFPGSDPREFEPITPQQLEAI